MVGGGASVAVVVDVVEVVEDVDELEMVALVVVVDVVVARVVVVSASVWGSEPPHAASIVMHRSIRPGVKCRFMKIGRYDTSIGFRWISRKCDSVHLAATDPIGRMELKRARCPMYEIESRIHPETPTLVVIGKAAVADMAEFFSSAYQAIGAHVANTSAHMTGPPFAKFKPLAGAVPRESQVFEVEAGFPVSQPVAGDGEVVGSSLPAAPVAVTWHVGPYDGLEEAYRALGEWVEANGGVAEPGWEVYYSDPATTDEADYRTEVIQPYRSE